MWILDDTKDLALLDYMEAPGQRVLGCTARGVYHIMGSWHDEFTRLDIKFIGSDFGQTSKHERRQQRLFHSTFSLYCELSTSCNTV